MKSLDSKPIDKIDWFVLRCFNIDNKDDTGFLALDIRPTSKDVYKIVESCEDAMRFPSKNVYGKDGFGTPKQWLEFFKGEDCLSNWKFHLVKVKPT